MSAKSSDICPLEECQERIKKGLVHRLEYVYSSKTHGLQNFKMVKEYRRPAAGRTISATSVRTPEALLQTTDYLLTEVCSRTDVKWELIYEFVLDRLRAVRQDMTVQELHNNFSVNILEKNIRFLLYSSFILAESPPSVYDRNINNTQVQECLKKLLNIYDMDGVCTCNMYEMYSYYLLFNLGDFEALSCGLELQKLNREHKTIAEAWQISLSFFTRDYYRAMKHLHNLTSLQLCAVFQNISLVQKHLLRILNHGFSIKNSSLPSEFLLNILQLDSVQQLLEIAQHYGLECDENSLKISKTAFRDGEKLKDIQLRWISNKLREQPVCELLNATSCKMCEHSLQILQQALQAFVF